MYDGAGGDLGLEHTEAVYVLLVVVILGCSI